MNGAFGYESNESQCSRSVDGRGQYSVSVGLLVRSGGSLFLLLVVFGLVGEPVENQERDESFMGVLCDEMDEFVGKGRL